MKTKQISSKKLVKKYHPYAFCLKCEGNDKVWFEILYHKSDNDIQLTSSFKDEFMLLSKGKSITDAWNNASEWITDDQS